VSGFFDANDTPLVKAQHSAPQQLTHERALRAREA
jgi:hypothetical protein